MSATKNINAEKIQGNLDVNGLSATTVNVNGNYSLPNTAGTDGQVLTINGSGGVEWSSVTKTTLNVNVSVGTNDQVPFMKSTNNDFEYSPDFTFNASRLRIQNSIYSNRIVDINENGYIEVENQYGKMIIQPSTTNVIRNNSANTDLAIYANNVAASTRNQLYLEYNNPNVGINNNAPAANLHIKPTVVGQRPFLVQNASGDNLLEVTTDGKVKISDSYTLPNNTPGSGNVIVADGAGGSSWGLLPVDPRWESIAGGTYSDGYSTGRVSSREFRSVELNISASTNPNIFTAATITESCLTLGGGNIFGNSGPIANTGILYHQLTIGTGNTIAQHRADRGLTIGENNYISVYENWPIPISSETNFYQNQTGYPNPPQYTGIAAHYTSNHFVQGTNNYLSGWYNFVSGNDNRIFGYSIKALGSGISGFTSVGGNVYTLRSTSILGDNIHAFWSNQILVGRGFSTENTNNKPGLYFGWATSGLTKPSMGLVDNDTGIGATAPNFAMGGVDVFTSGATTGIFQEGAGSGIFYLYRDASTVEPYDTIPSAVGLFAKQSPRGVTGLAVRAEDGTYSMFTDTVSIGFTGGTAMLEVKSKGADDTTDMLKVKNSNGDVGLQITDGLNVYMPNLPITPGGLSAGGLYLDTSTNTIKVV